MLATKQEQFTVWIYQGAHMGERAATVGVGLMDGYIYFRPSNDSIGSDERILRDKYYVELSDGTEYMLGNGASSAKITIRDLGYLNGEARIEVIGNPDVGVGVSRILRRVVIEYDDGKVAILDEDQLKIIMAELHDEVSKSLDNLSVDVKEELRNDMDSLGNEIKDTVRAELASGDASVLSQADSKVSALRTEVDTHVSTLRSEADTKVESLRTSLEPRIVLVENSVTSLGNEMESLQRDLSGAVEDKVRMAQWTLVQATVGANGAFYNMLHEAPTVKKGDTIFTHKPNGGTMYLNTTNTTVDRLLSVTMSATVDIPDEYTGFVTLYLRNSAGGAQAQFPLYFDRHKGTARYPDRVQWHLSLFIPGDFNNHPLYDAGFKLDFHNSGNKDVVIKPGNLLLSLTTA